MKHEHLKRLNNWCQSTPELHLWVNFQNRTCDWAVRVLTHARGKAHPLRTCTGSDLEALCEEIMPKAQEAYRQQLASIQRQFKEYQKRQSRNAYEDTREIEAMHHTANDF